MALGIWPFAEQCHEIYEEDGVAIYMQNVDSEWNKGRGYKWLFEKQVGWCVIFHIGRCGYKTDGKWEYVILGFGSKAANYSIKAFEKYSPV